MVNINRMHCQLFLFNIIKQSNTITHDENNFKHLSFNSDNRL